METQVNAEPSALSTGSEPAAQENGVAASPPVSARQLQRATLTGAVGSALEYYDFAIYGLASALVFGHLFFPSLGTTAGLMASFATYGAGFLARPFGGLFFGSIGDRKGRKFVLLVTIALMGASTTLIGCLPAGSLGAVLLVLLRLVQGFGAGAEQAGASTLMAEVAPVRHRGFFAALPFVGIFAGLGLATFTFSVMQRLLSEPAMQSWGWRIPFLASVVLIGVAIWIRLRLRESPVFAQLEASREVIHAPMKAVLATARRPVLAATLMRFAEQGGSTIYTTVVIAFLGSFVAARTGVPHAQLAAVGTTGALAASLLSIITTPLFGALSDRVGRLTVYRGGAIFLLLWSLPSWWMISTGDPIWVSVAMIGGLAFGANSMLGAQCAHFTELFGNRYRYSGVALSRELGAVLSGGIAPLLGVYLIGLAGGAFWVMGLYMAVLCALTLAGTFLSTETRERDLTLLGDAVGKGASTT
ncbi:MHS family MFS transporter [Paraburkholderia megapolitana]|uniref:MFS transporter, MHS family, metabolite:H+ symporter n=1 Tax=Paraburkholderia megapolitana TaxID=420953 RepID=A0A1I3EP93_9BURK|nr:MFS transporter [Paraburkholderia megapolitana]QDQ80195.1 MHS family MFS transporter [Paraburkholderia megapolitana]SFI00762.1 MFS transporter, MHS family, metabolite:H+ symporter [Paraburkholderia megapolitana]